MAPLSARAQAWLETLPRHTPVSTEEAAEALKRRIGQVHEEWLDFHARFAGYEESLGNESAVWGVLHRAPRWLEPGEVSIETEGARRLIACADAHPSFDFRLYESGKFSGLGGGGRELRGPCRAVGRAVGNDERRQSVADESRARHRQGSP